MLNSCIQYGAQTLAPHWTGLKPNLRPVADRDLRKDEKTTIKTGDLLARVKTPLGATNITCRQTTTAQQSRGCCACTPLLLLLLFCCSAVLMTTDTNMLLFEFLSYLGVRTYLVPGMHHAGSDKTHISPTCIAEIL